MNAENPPAFPTVSSSRAIGMSGETVIMHEGSTGLTLRDYFAAAALQAIVVKNKALCTAGCCGKRATLAEMEERAESFSCGAYMYADAMLAERAKGNAP